MKTSELKSFLQRHPDHELRFVLPDGDTVPAHAHITEVGRIDKAFIDCGGTRRQLSNTTLQAWVATDVDHRLAPAKLARIVDLAAPLFHGDDLDVELEYEDCSISQYPVLSATIQDGALIFQLGEKHTDCLAKEQCGLEPAASGCCGDSGCC